MAWEWSHTNEAYDNARDNLDNAPRDFLNVAFAEWKAKGIEDRRDGRDPFGPEYEQALRDAAMHMGRDALAEAIWDHASAQATCDNGGFNAWVCPYGCHTVSFDCVSSD